MNFSPTTKTSSIHVSASQSSGFIVLMAIIVMGAVAVVSSLIILTLSANGAQVSAIVEQSNQAKALADACTEYALDALHQNPAYSGDETINLGFGDCSIEPVSLSGELSDMATIETTGTVDDVVRKVEAVAQVTVVTEGEIPEEQTTTTTVQLQSLQEVANF